MTVDRKPYVSEFGTVAFVEKVMVPKATYHRLRGMLDVELEKGLALVEVFEEDRSSPKKKKRRRVWWRRKPEYYTEEAIGLNLNLEMCPPFEFEDTLKILRIGTPSIFESLTDGYKYSGRLSGLLKLMVENGIPKGGVVSGRWRITRDSWKTLWYLEYLGPKDLPF